MKSRVIISIVLLVVLTGLVLSGNTTGFDSLVYNFVISFQSDKLTSIMKIITFFSSVKLIIILGVVALIPLIFKKKESLYIVGTLGVTVCVNLLLKNFIRRERPSILRLIEETGYSYPSGHAMVSMAFYGSIIVLIMNSKLDKKYKWIASVALGLLIFLVGLSRIYLGVHYISDILGGWLISFIILNLLNHLIKKKII